MLLSIEASSPEHQLRLSMPTQHTKVAFLEAHDAENRPMASALCRWCRPRRLKCMLLYVINQQ